MRNLRALLKALPYMPSAVWHPFFEEIDLTHLTNESDR